MHRAFLSLLIGFAVAVPGWTGQIVSTTGTDDFAPILASPFSNSVATVAASWTLTRGYTNVVITARLVGSGLAFLTDAIGGSLGPEILVAPVTTFNTGGFDTNPTLFAGISLGPGTYFLLATSSAQTSGAWAASNNPSVNVGPDASIGDDFIAFGTQSFAFPPGATFTSLGTAVGGTGRLLYSVTGDSVAGNAGSVPEPGTVVLAAGVFALILKSRRRRSS